jgi:hypothetical protein
MNFRERKLKVNYSETDSTSDEGEVEVAEEEEGVPDEDVPVELRYIFLTKFLFRKTP